MQSDNWCGIFRCPRRTDLAGPYSNWIFERFLGAFAVLGNVDSPLPDHTYANLKHLFAHTANVCVCVCAFDTLFQLIIFENAIRSTHTHTNMCGPEYFVRRKNLPFDCIYERTMHGSTSIASPLPAHSLQSEEFRFGSANYSRCVRRNTFASATSLSRQMHQLNFFAVFNQIYMVYIQFIVHSSANARIFNIYECMIFICLSMGGSLSPHWLHISLQSKFFAVPPANISKLMNASK